MRTQPLRTEYAPRRALHFDIASQSRKRRASGMFAPFRYTWLSRLVVICLLFATRPALADDELAQRATWSVPTPAQVQSQLDELLKTKTLAPLTQAKIKALWPAESGPQTPSELLQQLVTTFALVNEKAREVVEFCQTQQMPVSLPKFGILNDMKQRPLMRHNLRLLWGQWLAQHQYYDESIVVLDKLAPDDVVDPAALLFYQATGHHRMPDKKQCLPIVAKLLENEEQIPRRYATVARLIQADIKPLKTDSLDEISRLMNEIQRRLELKRAGKRVRNQEDEVIAKLDKLIKKLEEQQQSASSSANLAPSTPATDSRSMGGKGPGKVDPKSIGNKTGWGNLPPKERQEALQQIGKDLPAHYREVIEEYFRKLAREGGGGGT